MKSKKAQIKDGQIQAMSELDILKATCETAIDGVLIVDSKSRSLMFNKNFGKLWRIPQRILKSRDDKKMLRFVLGQLKHPKKFIEKVNYLYSHKNEKSRDELEFKDGRIFDRYSAPLKNKKYYGRVWYFRDITERKKIEVALRESETQFKTIFDNANDGLILADQKTKKLYLGNKKFLQMLGYTKKELEGLEVMDIHPKKDLPYVLGQFKKQSRGEISISKDLPVKRKDGSVFYADINAAPLRIGKITYTMGVFRDATERRKAIEDIKKETEKISRAKALDEAVFQSIGDGLVVTDKEGKIILANKAFEDLLGWRQKEVFGRRLIKVVPCQDERGLVVPDEKRIISLALKGVKNTTPAVSQISWYFVRKNKTRFPVTIVTTPIYFQNQLFGAVETFHDITKEHEIDKAKTEFVSLASHQLRTPLSIIRWYSEVLLKNRSENFDKKDLRYLEEINKSNQRMIDLINALLNVSRIDMGTLAIEPKPTNLIDLAENVLKDFAPQISQKKLELIRDYSKSLPLIDADPQIMRIVFQNLISNAIKYTPDKGEIKLKMGAQKDEMVIEVSDTGYGIPKDQQGGVYQKFFRADNAREIDPDGSGLGLYIVKSIVDNAGGKIWFKSEEKKGTTFYVAIPLSGMQKKEGVKGLIL